MSGRRKDRLAASRRLRAALLTSTLALGSLAAAHAQSGPFLYAPNSGDATVSVIDTTTNAVSGSTINVGSNPFGAAVRGDQSLVYVTNTSDDTVSVINTATNTVTAIIPVGNGPQGVAVSADGSRVYVANVHSDTVSVIDAATNTVAATIPVGSLPLGIAVSADGSRLYVTSTTGNTVSVIDTATNTVTATIPVGNAPQGVAVSADGSRVYVANSSGNTVSVINAAINAVTATIPVGNGPVAVAVSPDGSHLYVVNGANQPVFVVDTATNTVTAAIPVGAAPRGVSVSPDGSRIYVTNAGDNTVSVINTATNTVMATLTVGNLPWSSGICGDGNALLAAGLTFKANTSGALACTGAGGPVFTGGTMQFVGAGIMSNLPITLMVAGGTFDTAGNNATLSGTIGGPGGFTKIGAGTLTLSGAGTYFGPTFVNAGTLQAGIANAFSPNSNYTIASGAALDLNGFDQTIGGLTGTGSVINGGAAIPTLTIASGGIFAPGNGMPGSSMAIAGNLAFQSGAIYQVQVNPSTASFATISGTATLVGASVNAVFAGGSYISKQYTILTATGGVSGTFASTVVDTNLPANFHTTLSYDANDAYLNLVLNFTVPGGLNGNQKTVGNALTNYFNTTGGIPLIYGALTAPGLTQASGESAAGSQQTTFQAMGQFMGLLTDPLSTGRETGSSAPPAYADSAPTGAARDAYAMLAKAPSANTFEQRWNVWAASFGGSQTTDGNTAQGSNSATSRLFGTAAGAEYAFSPQTLAGFALAGGGTSFSVAGSGTGRSDLFQAGAYLRHTNGPSYISAALAYGWQDVTTDRTVTLAGVDRLRAEFNANAWSGRLEGGYRFVAPWVGGIGLTPYAAGQFTTFDLPAYAETVVSGGGAFALAYGAKSVTDTRSELGLRTDKSFAMADGVLTLRGRAAWTHDFNPDGSVAATFQALPGASFVVNGARAAADSVLTTVSADMKWLNRWSAAASFEGEFSSVTRSYAGKGTVRYAW